jgi:hypothetical protein
MLKKVGAMNFLTGKWTGNKVKGYFGVPFSVCTGKI